MIGISEPRSKEFAYLFGAKKAYSKPALGGNVGIVLPATDEVFLLTSVLPGYDTAKTVLRAGTKQILIKLALAGTVEGKELVVERPKPEKSEAQAGVSQVATKGQITSTTLGIVQDVMSTVKRLPGVSYTSPFSARPSVQGGNPNELTATLDGAYVLYPYHWGGVVSIFDPNMVQSVKLSDGIVPAN